jgi:hypothetical protein
MAENTFTEEYINKTFYVWYDNDKRVTRVMIDTLPEDETGKRPAYTTVQAWVDRYGWVERADELDAKANNAMDNVAVEKRKKMYEQQEQVANELIEKGLAFLRETGIDSSNNAIRAIDLGLSTQRTVVGVVEQFAKISKMDDKKLLQELVGILNPEKDEEPIDGIVKEEDDR